jgi:pyruvate ferredoxin oxidoreductase beta subunit
MPRVLNAAVDSRFWPLYEVVDGAYSLSYDPDPPIPVADWLRLQKRFAHLLEPSASAQLEEIQKQVDADWNDLIGRCTS